MRVGAFLVLMLVLAGAGFLLVQAALGRPYAAAVVGLVLGSIPILVAKHKKQQRTLRFEEQFPDALDMLTSALRAGLALTGAISALLARSREASPRVSVVPGPETMGVVAPANRMLPPGARIT